MKKIVDKRKMSQEDWQVYRMKQKGIGGSGGGHDFKYPTQLRQAAIYFMVRKDRPKRRRAHRQRIYKMGQYYGARYKKTICIRYGVKSISK